MHMLYRTLVHWFLAQRMSKIGISDVSTSYFRVAPTDLDVYNHMNNGKYLALMDVARQTLIIRAGMWDVFRREGWAPVVAASTIAYRKSLQPNMKFAIESRIIGFDEQAVYLEQRFVRPDAHGENEIYARAYVRGRFLKRAGGVVRIDELLEKTGIDPAAFDLSSRLLDWAELVQLPSTRADAPNHWN